MGWNISHVSTKKESEPSPCLQLPTRVPAWLCWSQSRILGWLQDSLCWCGAWTLAESWGSSSFPSESCSWAVRWALRNLRLTHWVLPGVQFWWESPGHVNKLIKKQLPLPASGGIPIMYCQTNVSSVYRHISGCQALFSAAVAVQTRGWHRNFVILPPVFWPTYIPNPYSFSSLPINTIFLVGWVWESQKATQILFGVAYSTCRSANWILVPALCWRSLPVDLPAIFWLMNEKPEVLLAVSVLGCLCWQKLLHPGC